MTKQLIHEKDFDIHWGDMDALGHMNNTMYFFYTQEARFAMLTEHNIEINTRGIAPVLAHTSFNFKIPIFYPERIKVQTYLESICDKKVLFKHVISKCGAPSTVYATGEALVIWYDFATKRSILPPKDVLAITNNIIS